MLRVLVIDDEKNIRTTLQVCLEGLGAEVATAGTPEAAIAAVERAPFDLAFLDLRLRDANGLDLLPRLLAVRPELGVIIVTAYATFDTAVEAVKRGAVDYLPKPFTPAQIQHAVEQATSRRAIARRVADLEQTLAREVPEADLETGSPKMRAVLDTLARAATADAPVLLRGESGTGKGVLARAIHAQSARASAPFVTVNCPTLSDDLLASELFGHVKGAFTGAVRDQPGRVEAAEGGTLFLDEIGEISPGLQAKLLRFLQEHQFERVGENQTRRADVRVLAATNTDLQQAVAGGRFRQDLYYRLDVLRLEVPPLRDRREDIPALAHHFLAVYARRFGAAATGFTSDAMSLLLEHRWPGNVRELEHIVERAVALGRQRKVLSPEQVRIGGQSCQDFSAESFQQAKRRLVEEFERSYLSAYLAAHSGNIGRAARAAKKNHRAFFQLMRKHAVDAEDFKDSSGRRSDS